MKFPEGTVIPELPTEGSLSGGAPERIKGLPLERSYIEICFILTNDFLKEISDIKYKILKENDV